MRRKMLVSVSFFVSFFAFGHFIIVFLSLVPEIAGFHLINPFFVLIHRKTMFAKVTGLSFI